MKNRFPWLTVVFEERERGGGREGERDREREGREIEREGERERERKRERDRERSPERTREQFHSSLCFRPAVVVVWCSVVGYLTSLRVCKALIERVVFHALVGRTTDTHTRCTDGHTRLTSSCFSECYSLRCPGPELSPGASSECCDRRDRGSGRALIMFC